MCGNLVIDVDNRLLQIALEDACIILRETVDVADTDGVVFLFFLTVSEAVTFNGCNGAFCIGGQDGDSHQCHDNNLFHSFCVFIR